jgi:hypothetical protein
MTDTLARLRARWPDQDLQEAQGVLMGPADHDAAQGQAA